MDQCSHGHSIQAELSSSDPPRDHGHSSEPPPYPVAQSEAVKLVVVLPRAPALAPNPIPPVSQQQAATTVTTSVTATTHTSVTTTYTSSSGELYVPLRHSQHRPRPVVAWNFAISDEDIDDSNDIDGREGMRQRRRHRRYHRHGPQPHNPAVDQQLMLQQLLVGAGEVRNEIRQLKLMILIVTGTAAIIIALLYFL